MRIVSLFCCLLSLVACNDSRSGGSQACASTSECGGAQVCVRRGEVSGCEATCTTSANACGATAQCTGVGSLNVNVCQEPPRPEDPPAPEEQPKLACKTDADCAAVQPGAVCAQFMGERDCTIPCTQESDCDTPSAGGLAFDFLKCTADEGDSSRTVCLPDPRCFTDINACFSAGDPFPDLPDGF